MTRNLVVITSLFALQACVFGTPGDGKSTTIKPVGTSGADGLADGGEVGRPDPTTDAVSGAETGPEADVSVKGDPDVVADTPSPPDVIEDPDVPKRPGCAEVNVECWDNNACCSGLCTYTGFDYSPGVCSAPQPSGAYCRSDAWCESGKCKGEVCAPEICVVEAANCVWSAECCSGFCTVDGAAYVQGVCAKPQPLGSPCQSDNACAEGTCIDGLCNDNPCPSGECPNQCKPAHQECWSHFDCCTGFCTYSGFDYTPGTCQPRQPLGGYCAGDPWCASTKCVDNVCVPLACQAAKAACYNASACCSGLCTWDGSEDAGECSAPQAAGVGCKSDAWCQSGLCQSGKCQATPAKPTFSLVYKQVIQARGCTTNFCHGSPGAPLALHTEKAAWDDLVGAPSTEDWCIPFRVLPGKPEESMLWQKVRPVTNDDTGPWCGPKMPLGTQGLSQADADLINAWILGGAAP
jgi:hypothetical protein